jgi:hypothetical protein
MQTINNFIYELAKYDKEKSKKSKKIIDYYEKIISKNMGCKLKNFYHQKNGAVYFTNEEIAILREEDPNNILFKIYDCDFLEDNRKYCCNYDDIVLLRGPVNYYFAFTQMAEFDFESCKDGFEMFKMESLFFSNALDILNECKDLKISDITSKKVYMAVLDNLRNAIIVELYFWLYSFNKKMDIYSYENVEDSTINNLYELIKKVLKHVYSIFIYGEKMNYTYISDMISNFLDIHKILLDYMEKNELSIYDACLKIRNWRETDNILELIISLEYSINEILNNKKFHLFDNKIYCIGMNYGSMDTAILGETILKEKGIANVTTINVMKKFRKMYPPPKYEFIKNSESIFEKGSLGIIFDENVLTGTTIKGAKEYLESKNIKIINAIIIRRPTINRAKNIFDSELNFDISEFDSYIIGLLYRTMYTKLSTIRYDFKFKYMDMRGVFDEPKNEIIEALYKNGIYKKDSTVGRISVYFKEYCV